MEDILRSKLAGVQQTPPDALRRKVEADFLRTRRKRVAFWWFFGGVSGVAALVLALLLWPSAPSGERMNPSAADDGGSVVSVESASALPVDGEPFPYETSDSSSDAQSSGESIAMDPTDVSDTESTRSATNTGSKEEGSGFNTISEVDPEAPPVVWDDSDEQDIERERVVITPSEREANPSAPVVAVVSNDGLNNTINPTSENTTEKQAELDRLPTRSVMLPVAAVENIDKSKDYPTPAGLPVLKEIGACPKWIIGASGGVGMSYRTLQSNVHDQLVEHKNQSEHASLSASAGIYAVATLLGKSGLKTGFTYLRVGERYHFENDHASHATTNTYEYLNMDLKFNQSLFCNDRLRLDVAVGTKLNLLRDAQSSWLDPNSFEAIAHNDEGEHSPFREYNLVWSADLTGYYFISRRAFVGLTIEADRFQNSIYKDAVELDQRPYVFQGYFNIGFLF